MRVHLLAGAGVAVGLLTTLSGCGSFADADKDESPDPVEQAVGDPNPNQVPLDATTIPKFAQQLPIPRTFAPTVITSGGQVVRHDYTVSVAKTLIQALPPPMPKTNMLAYGGNVKALGSLPAGFVRSSPGPVFDNTQGIPARVNFQNEIRQPHFLAVDPTLHRANPLFMEPPVAPFTPFPPGYLNAQSIVPHVTHTHGLVVRADQDGTAELWFTPSPGQIVGPRFVTRTYDMPNEQLPTALFYHEHALGDTRLGVYAGLAGAAYIIRDPAGTALDAPNSPLPKGEYEIPLVFTARGFFTDGELAFPRGPSSNPRNAYWVAGDGSNTNLVNGAVWPNLNVERRQYRFRMLAAANGAVFQPQIVVDSSGQIVPMTLIGTDGGYLPAPQVLDDFQIGITERADVLVDFSGFAPGTTLTLKHLGGNAGTTDVLMRFTVQNTTPVPPPALDPGLFPPMPNLPTNAPRNLKVFMNLVDADGNAERSVDGLLYSSPPTDIPTVGTTERWDILNVGGGNHQVHLHLIEFKVISRQPINTAAYLEQWRLLNGFRPITRQIEVDPTPFLTGTPTLEPYDTGWKDTVRAPGNQLTVIHARWAPQETPDGGVQPGQNQFPIDPTAAQGSYVMHCHVLSHEDNDMMRTLPIAPVFAGGVNYPKGRLITHNQINYRVRVAHTSSAGQPPPTRFDRYERVNNNDGSWAPQIIYAVGDRVLHNGQLFRALTVHQAQNGQPPPSAQWEALPMTACGQLQSFCADDTGTSQGATCLATGNAGNEATCRAQLGTCLPVCEPVHASPCDGLCNNPISFSVADGGNFQSGNLGTGEVCYETTSEIQQGSSSSFVSPRRISVNGVDMPVNGNWPALPPQRNEGYCIQAPPGNNPWAAFQVN